MEEFMLRLGYADRKEEPIPAIEWRWNVAGRLLLLTMMARVSAKKMVFNKKKLFRKKILPSLLVMTISI